MPPGSARPCCPAAGRPAAPARISPPGLSWRPALEAEGDLGAEVHDPDSVLRDVLDPGEAARDLDLVAARDRDPTPPAGQLGDLEQVLAGPDHAGGPAPAGRCTPSRRKDVDRCKPGSARIRSWNSSSRCCPPIQASPPGPTTSPIPLQWSAAQELLDRHSRRSPPCRGTDSLRRLIAVVVPVALGASHSRAPAGPPRRASPAARGIPRTERSSAADRVGVLVRIRGPGMTRRALQRPMGRVIEPSVLEPERIRGDRFDFERRDVLGADQGPGGGFEIVALDASPPSQGKMLSTPHGLVDRRPKQELGGGEDLVGDGLLDLLVLGQRPGPGTGGGPPSDGAGPDPP